MGVDYVARKSAKKRKRRERQAVGKDGVAQRERRRKKIRRLCQGVCYKAPELTEEDKQWSDQEQEDNAGALDSDVEEAVARVNSHQGASTSAAAMGTALDNRLPKQSASADGKKNKKKQKRKRGDADDDGDGGGGGGRTKLSTSVQLLAPSVLAQNARQAAIRKLPAGAKTDALERFPPLLQACMLSLHHLEPTPVQEQCWPPAIDGRDVQGVAEPGSGKTLAYLLPGLVKLQTEGHDASSHPEGPAMLVLLPTRELAQQVAAQCRALRAVTGMRTICVFGGAAREEQAALLSSKQPHVLVATPGRLLDLVDGGELKLQGTVRYLVLDEADKMLSLGFKPQLDRLYDMLLKSHDEATATAAAAAIRKKKAKTGTEVPPPASAGSFGLRPQVLLFSATMPEMVAAAAAQWLRRPEVVLVSSTGANAISRTVTQVVQVCAEHKKPEKLLKHLSRVRDSAPPGCRNPPRVLVFANRVKTVRFLTTTLSREGYKVAQLHGQRSQVERNQAVADFRSGKAQVLVATDVAARGLDIRSLPYVVNYDFPSSLETYVHRVGRTGRLAAYGHAYSFFSRNLAPLAPPLLELLRAHDQAVDPNLMALAAAWKLAEEKLGGKGVAAAHCGAAEADHTDGDGEDDDEGDGRAAGAAERLSLAEEVLIAAEDLMEGLGPRDARAIAALVKKKLARKQPAEPPGENGDTSAADVAAAAPDAADNANDDDVDVATRGKKPRRGESKPLKGAAVNVEGPSKRGATSGGGGGGRVSDTYLVPMSREQRKAMQQQQQQLQQEEFGNTVVKRQAAFVPAKAFTGAMVGYAFKKGPMGLGYYMDQHQVAAAEGGRGLKVAAKVAASPPGKKAPVAAAAVGNSKASGKKTAGAADTSINKKKAAAAAVGWGLPTRNKPIIPVRHSDFLSDSDDDSKSGGGGGGNLDSALDSDLDPEKSPVAGLRGRRNSSGNIITARNSMLLGVGKEKMRNDRGPVSENGVKFSFGADEGDDDDFGDTVGQRAIAKRRHKALPGRLRQKLKGQKKQG